MIIISKQKKSMYSLSSSQADRKSKYGKVQPDTGTDFAKEDSFNFEIEAEREYVHRLKMQRQKIEALYNKYDSLLEEMRKKDERIRDQQAIIGDLTSKYKELSLIVPEMDLLRKEHSDLFCENEQARKSLGQVEEAYHRLLSDQKNRRNSTEEEKERIEEMNEELASKLRILHQKYEDKHSSFEKERKVLGEKMQELKREIQANENKHIGQISFINSELLRREEQIDILSKENQKLREIAITWEQSNLNLMQQNQEKITKIQSDNKNKVKSVKQEIQGLNYNNELLSNKIATLNVEIEKLMSENSTLRGLVNEEKKISEETLFQMKLQGNQERSIMREKCIQLESKLAKLEKQLGDSHRREKQLTNHIKKLEESEQVKKSLRCMQRRELEKINRLLLLQK